MNLLILHINYVYVFGLFRLKKLEIMVKSK